MNKVSRNYQRTDSIISVGKVIFGEDRNIIIAGPCAVESEAQIKLMANKVKKSGASILRGGAFKPRTSPYSFQGTGQEGLQWLKQAGRQEEMPVVSEIVDASQIEMFKDIDILQVGARNMQNFFLLKALGAVNKPILLKRGFGATLEEFLNSAEYLLYYGNPKVILCERGVRGINKETRFTLDMESVPLLRRMTHLPVIVDPSHACGDKELVKPLSKASIVCGAQGLMIEVNDEPRDKIKCDGEQALTTEEFAQLVKEISLL